MVTCRAHGWRDNVTTGNTLHVPDYGVQTFPVKVVDGIIMIAVATPPSAAAMSRSEVWCACIVSHRAWVKCLHHRTRRRAAISQSRRARNVQREGQRRGMPPVLPYRRQL